jgi:hypothetical protein
MDIPRGWSRARCTIRDHYARIGSLLAGVVDQFGVFSPSSSLNQLANQRRQPDSMEATGSANEESSKFARFAAERA